MFVSLMRSCPLVFLRAGTLTQSPCQAGPAAGCARQIKGVPARLRYKPWALQIAARRCRPRQVGQPCDTCRTRRRSEEHTSELQSPCNLVCRLLLEKKKNKHTRPYLPLQRCPHSSPLTAVSAFSPSVPPL